MGSPWLSLAAQAIADPVSQVGQVLDAMTAGLGGSSVTPLSEAPVFLAFWTVKAGSPSGQGPVWAGTHLGRVSEFLVCGQSRDAAGVSTDAGLSRSRSELDPEGGG